MCFRNTECHKANDATDARTVFCPHQHPPKVGSGTSDGIVKVTGVVCCGWAASTYANPLKLPPNNLNPMCLTHDTLNSNCG